MGMIVLLSAVAGGVCGLLDGHERRIQPAPEPEPACEVLPPGSGAAGERHQANVKKQMYEWMGRFNPITADRQLTREWVCQEWEAGRIVPPTALEYPDMFASYLTKHANGIIKVRQPWDQYDTNQRSIA